MEEKINSESLSQKDYQKKYDKKTKMISIKYVLSDMDDYNRLMDYLERTKQSKNEFIKRLIKNFLEYQFVISERKIADYFKDYCVSEELLEKLKNEVGNDRFNLIMNYYRGCIETEISDAYESKGYSFEEWIEQFLEDIKSGDIDINVSEKDFTKIIDTSISETVADVFCS